MPEIVILILVNIQYNSLVNKWKSKSEVRMGNGVNFSSWYITFHIMLIIYIPYSNGNNPCCWQKKKCVRSLNWSVGQAAANLPVKEHTNDTYIDILMEN